MTESSFQFPPDRCDILPEGVPALEGIGIARGFFEQEEQEGIVDCLEAHKLEVSWGRTMDGSYAYNVFSNDPVAVDRYDAVDAMPQLLNDVAGRIFAALNMQPHTIWAHANTYNGMTGIERHQDPDSWQTDMAIVNLQSPVVFHVYQISQSVSAHCILEPGDVLFMSRACMEDNEHEVRTAALECCSGETVRRRINRVSVAFHDVQQIS